MHTQDAIQQCVNKGEEEEDFNLVNVNVNMSGCKKDLALQMLYEGGHAVQLICLTSGIHTLHFGE